MDNLQTLTTLRTQDTRQINVEKIKGSIKNGQSTDIDNIENTRHKTNKRERKSKGQSRMDNLQTLTTLRTQDTRQINVRENQRVNQEWTIYRH